jgi:hypothetical protein
LDHERWRTRRWRKHTSSWKELAELEIPQKFDGKRAFYDGMRWQVQSVTAISWAKLG